MTFELSDVKKSYRLLYERKPRSVQGTVSLIFSSYCGNDEVLFYRGVRGSMEDTGLEWIGQEHSGIDDAKNTARLAWKMLQDGWVVEPSERSQSGGMEETKGTPVLFGPKEQKPMVPATAYIPAALVRNGLSVGVTAPLCKCGKRSRKVSP